MSAATEQRAWQRPRPSGGAARNSQSQQSRSSNASPAQTSAPFKPATPAPGNVWAQKAHERSRSATPKIASAPRDGSSGAKEAKKVDAPTAPAAPASTSKQSQQQHHHHQQQHHHQQHHQQHHVPVNGFNASEVRDFLKPGKMASYKIKDAETASKTGPLMANGQNFYEQLNKQVAALKSNNKQ